MNLALVRDRYGAWIVRAPDGRERFFHSDRDMPGLAMACGWEPCLQCRDTDGTINCSHRSASEMMSEARDFLDDYEGATFEDPGYFPDDRDQT